MDQTSKTARLKEVATIERAKKGAVYPGGETLIELSATKGRVLFHPDPGQVETRYGVITPTIDIIPEYFFLVIERGLPEFIARYLTTINLQVGTVGMFRIRYHTDKETQAYWVDLMRKFDAAISGMTELIEREKQIKQAGLHYLFTDGREE